jgi:hypothetical protein
MVRPWHVCKLSRLELLFLQYMNIIFEPSDCRVTLKRVTPSVAVASDILIEIIILIILYFYLYFYL